MAGVALLNSDSPGVTALVAPEAALEPAPFTAVTVNVYAVPAVRPVTRRSVALAPAGDGRLRPCRRRTASRCSP